MMNRIHLHEAGFYLHNKHLLLHLIILQFFAVINSLIHKKECYISIKKNP